MARLFHSTEIMAETANISPFVKPIAIAGLIAKGFVYCLLGVFAFMAAFNLNGQSEEKTKSSDLFGFVYEQTGGLIILAVIALGLICYSLWRGMQTFMDTEEKGKTTKGLAIRLRYFFSGLLYASLAAIAIKLLFTGEKDSSDSNQGMAEELMSKPFGAWLVAIAGVCFAAIGIYQIVYGLSDKHKKHTTKAKGLVEQKPLLIAGMIGYISRGLVWLIIAWLFIKAALNSNPSEAGDTSKAFSFLSEASYGSYLLAATGLGLICYGLFNFIRVKYDRL